MPFVKIPYLPKGRVLVAIGDVEIENVVVIKPFRIACLPHSMKYHADLSICYLGHGVAVCSHEAYDYYKKELLPYNIKLIRGAAEVGSNYPFDAAYNVAIVGDKIFCKEKLTDRILLNTAKEMGYKIININQGYAKCSVCPVDENSAISADASFLKAAEKEGLDTLKISNTEIKLEGFSEGFFGGCAFMAGEKQFFVKGDIKTLPDEKRITQFLQKRKITIENGMGAVQDFGSFIPIIEE